MKIVKKFYTYVVFSFETSELREQLVQRFAAHVSQHIQTTWQQKLQVSCLESCTNLRKLKKPHKKSSNRLTSLYKSIMRSNRNRISIKTRNADSTFVNV